MGKHQAPEEAQGLLPPDLMNHEDIESVMIILDDDCTPCQLVNEHLKRIEESGGNYPGTIEVVDIFEADRFFDDDKIGIPAAIIKRKDGTEQPCKIFMNEETLALQCDGKLLILRDVPNLEITESSVASPSVVLPDDLPSSH